MSRSIPPEQLDALIKQRLESTDLLGRLVEEKIAEAGLIHPDVVGALVDAKNSDLVSKVGRLEGKLHDTEQNNIDLVNNLSKLEADLNKEKSASQHQQAGLNYLSDQLKTTQQELTQAVAARLDLENKVKQVSLQQIAMAGSSGSTGTTSAGGTGQPAASHGTSVLGTSTTTAPVTGATTASTASTATSISGHRAPRLSLSGGTSSQPASLGNAPGGFGSIPPGLSGLSTGLGVGGAIAGGLGFHGAKPLSSNLKFGGTEREDWLSFRRQFSFAVLLANYNDAQAKAGLFLCMTGPAQLTVQDEDHMDPGRDINQLLDIYEEKFMPPAASAMAMNKFEQAMQQPRESILQFHGRVRQLYARAYPNNVGMEILPIRVFSQGLSRQLVKAAVLRKNPTTMAAALEAAQQEQSVIEQMNPQAADGRGGFVVVQKQDGINAMDPNSIDAMRAGDKCWNCGKTGHPARDCRATNGQPQRGGFKKNLSRNAAGARNAGGAAKGRMSPKKRNKVIAALDAEDSDDDNEEEEVVENPDQEEEDAPDQGQGDPADEGADFS